MSNGLLTGLGLATLLAGGASADKATSPAQVPETAQNPLLAPWSGPYGGVPPFDLARVELFRPALEAAMAEKLAEISALAANPEPATFANTIAALESTGRTLDRVEEIYGVFAGTMSTPEVQALEREMAPRMAALADQITQNEKLFARIEAVYQTRESSGLTSEQQRLVWLRYTSFARAGARLDGPAKQRLSEINQRLATLFTQFSQNILADETDYVLEVSEEADLAGLPPSLRSAAAAAAESRGRAGSWAILNTRSSMEPFLTYSDRRDLREKVWRTYFSRGDNGDKHDNNAGIAEILKLRGERAKLIGYANHAERRLEDSMAKTPERTLELMEAMWKPAVARVHEEVADMQKIAGAAHPIEPWDYRYYAEKVRKARYDLDENEVKPYLQLEKLREGMFWVAGELLGLRFSPVAEVPVYHPDVRVWKVTKESGELVGLWYFDPYARPGKRSGAWMNAYRNQERFAGEVKTIVSNNSNFVKGRAGEAVLISWSDAETLFHEFGHALHGLSSNVTYPSLAGTNVARDYVEFPSQLLEHWLSTPEVLDRFALHVETGKPMPRELVAKIERAATFNQGFATVEFLASALIDMKLHLAAAGGGITIDPDRFERETLAALGMPKEIVMRHRTPQFSHIFSSDSYSAGYYSYLWADTLTADAWDAFTEAGGGYDKTVAKRLYDYVFSVGNTVDPAEAYRAFRGKEAGIEALMRDRGFAPPAAAGAGAARK